MQAKRAITFGVSALLCALFAGVVLPVVADWSRVEVGGKEFCKDSATGSLYAPVPYTDKKQAAQATTACKTLSPFLSWLGTAEAANVTHAVGILVRNADGTYDESYPAGNKPPSSPTLACADSSAPPLTGLQTGSAYLADVRQYFTGTAAATATLSVVNVAGSVTDATTQWSISSAGAGNNLVNAGSVAGSGALKVRGTTGGNSVDCSARNWSYVAPPSTDTNPPFPVTGITAVPGVGNVLVTADQTTDPNDSVQRTGVATYRIKLNGATVDTQAAATAGLVNDYTATAIGTTGSAVQAAAPNGAKWTITNSGSGGPGLENGQADSIEAALMTVAGSTACVTSQVTSLPLSGTYNKAVLVARNSSSTTAASLTATELRTAGGYSIQYNLRPNDGGSSSNSATVNLTGIAWMRQCHVNNVATIQYSYDGGTWSTAFSGVGITLGASKLLGCASAATNDGVSGVSIAVDMTCSVSDATTWSKTVTSSCTGTCLWTVTAIDATTPTPNESTAVGSVSAVPSSGSPVTAKKWHPGYYLTTHRNNTCLDNQSCRFTDYDNNGSNTHLQGYHWLAKWSAFESTQGNYTAGIALIRAELAHVKAESPAKRLVIQIMDEPNQSQCGSFACQAAFFPSYVASACIVTSSFNGYSATHLAWWRPACAGYLANLLTAIGAAVDSDVALEAVILDYEQALEQDVVHGTDFSLGAFNAGVATVAAAAKAAFPKTNIVWRANWGVDYTNDALTTLISTMKTNGIGWGDQDACDLNPVTGAYTYLGELPSYISADNMIAGYKAVNGVWTAGQATDQRGKMLMFFGIETSSMGDNAVCGSPGLTGLTLNTNYGSYFDWVDQAMRATHAIIDYNDYAGIAEQKWAHAASNKSFYDMVQLSPLTHTACPTDYDTQFGNGSAGTGCDTSN
jgi:hypothetical protein